MRTVESCARCSHLGQVRDDAEPEVQALTREDLAAFLQQVPDEWRLFFELLAHSGLRISEALGLTWADAELGERPRLRLRSQMIRGKRRQLESSYARSDIRLSAGMARRLWAQRRESPYRGDEAPVFASTTGTHLLPENVRRRVLNPARKRAGFDWVGFHTFRHTCASSSRRAGT